MYVDSEIFDAAEKDAKDLVEIHKVRLSNKDTRRSFYMQELDGASSGDKASKKWVKSKGINPAQYKHALMDDNRDAEKIQMSALMTAMSWGFKTKDRAAYKCLLVDNMMEQSEGFINADK
jgi:hypothetical protein